MGFLGDLGLQVAGGAINSLFGKLSADKAFERQKELMDYQMKLQDTQFKKYTSPQAQVSNLAAAGINPAVAMGNQSPVFAPSPSPGAVAPAQFGIGTTSLTDLAQYLLAKAQTKNIDVETEAKKFELELSKWFSAPEKVANITLAWKNVMLKDDEHNINEWKKATEEALSQLKGIERDSAKKLFENMDTVIQQENKQREENIKLTKEKQKTEGTQQSANRAAAKASQSQAELNQHQQQLIDYQADFQDMVNKVKRSNLSSEMLTELKKILANRALSEAEQKEAQLRMQHVEAFINARNMSAAWREFDNACNWISSKISASISGSFSSTSKD